MEIRWKASFSASCLHAVLSSEMGFAAAEGALAELIAEPAETLIALIAENRLTVRPTLSMLGSLASEYENNRQLVEISLARLHGPGATKEETTSQIAAAIGVLESKVLAARPEMVDGLSLRGKPLQEQWQARGPGLLKQVERLTAESFLAQAAEVVCVTPWVGGYGRADLKTNRVIFEAVLANPHADLPEALRLGWLLAQLQADVPIYSEPLQFSSDTAAERLQEIAALATLPVVLAAAETVEWTSCTEANIQRAIECWHVGTASPADTAEKLFRWWQTYEDGARSWEVAWRGLDMLLR